MSSHLDRPGDPYRRDYVTGLLPALLLFSVGLACTVAPLTATVLADADDSDAGVASGVNNAIARVAGLLAIAAVGAVISATFTGDLDRRLRGLPLSAAGRAGVAQARSQTSGSAGAANVLNNTVPWMNSSTAIVTTGFLIIVGSVASSFHPNHTNPIDGSGAQS